MVKQYTNKTVSRCLTRSVNGWYTFRRKVPVDVQKDLGRKEIKKSLKTKDVSIALSSAAALYQKYEDQFNRLREAQGLLGSISQTKTETILKANLLAMDYGVHPDQAPVLRAGATEQERKEFERQEKEYLKRREIYFDAAGDLLLDKRHREDAYKDGRWSSPEYTDKYRQPNIANLQEATYAVVEGNTDALRSRTFSDALEVYLSEPKRIRNKTDRQLNKTRADKTRSIRRLAHYLGHGDVEKGLQIDVTSLSKAQLKDYYNYLINDADSNGRSLGTVNKTFGDVQAIISSAYSNWEISLTNPCAGIVDKESAYEEAKDRRSFRPAELEKYRKFVLESNEQLGLIGLIMIETGCRTKEATLLSNDDVFLKAKVPHLKIRHNHLRRLDKKGLERDFPITGELLDRLRSYSRPSEQKAPFFPRYGKPNSPETVSQNLRNIVRKKMGISDESLVPYSTRHTFADRCNSAMVYEPLKLYLMGHKSRYSTEIADRYGDGRLPVSQILKAVTDQLAISDWGDSGWDDELAGLN